jgi:hypothetical protein
MCGEPGYSHSLLYPTFIIIGTGQAPTTLQTPPAKVVVWLPARNITSVLEAQRLANTQKRENRDRRYPTQHNKTAHQSGQATRTQERKRPVLRQQRYQHDRGTR